MINIVICGGSGTRLWPISTPAKPKQFLTFFGDKSLFSRTIKRNSRLCNSFTIICGERHIELAQRQSTHAKKVNFILEPIGRNTAPAITLACLTLDKEEVVFVTPADHIIEADDRFKQAVQKAEALAKRGYLVVFGIVPTHPETGYGYIKAEKEDVIEFVEKPNSKKAKEYLQSGDYFWNSGMFCFSVSTFLEEIKTYEPQIYKSCLAAYKNSKQADCNIRVEFDDMMNIEKKSVDYAVMEKSKRVKFVPMVSTWSDVGSFDALWDVLPKDEAENVVSDKNFQLDSKGNLLLAQGKQVTLIGVENSIVVCSKNKVLVCKRGESQKVNRASDFFHKLKKE